ncbi:MAG: aldo/keto reductase [Dehalococcoidales bacterium]|nr:aldo/keto reductase [Dehalococcoidales bacterium]
MVTDLKKLGTTGIELPAIGMGTWEIGGDMSRDTSGDKQAIRALTKAIEFGLYLIDTAEMYGAGHAEELVGEAIKPYPRERLFLVSKVWRNHMHYADVIQAAENSLKRLQTDWLDLYLVHFPSDEVPMRETIQAMEELVTRNLVRFIGVSNFDVRQMEEAGSYLTSSSLVANQVDYSLLVRDAEGEVLPYCQRQRLTLMAHRPLARGGLVKNELLQKIGAKYGKTASQVALNWLIAQEGVIAIPKAANLKHLEENAGAMGWRLSAEDLGTIAGHFRQ